VIGSNWGKRYQVRPSPVPDRLGEAAFPAQSELTQLSDQINSQTKADYSFIGNYYWYICILGDPFLFTPLTISPLFTFFTSSLLHFFTSSLLHFTPTTSLLPLILLLLPSLVAILHPRLCDLHYIMLAPRVARTATSLLRPFSTSAIAYRSPSIRDVTAESTEEFLRRQKEFRENLEQARLRKEQVESQSVNASVSSSTPSRESAPTAPQVSNASSDSRMCSFDAAQNLDHKAMGSLSMHRYLGEEQQQEAANKRGPLSSLIYGTKEGQHFDKDMERSFSQVLARGKYVHSIRSMNMWIWWASGIHAWLALKRTASIWLAAGGRKSVTMIPLVISNSDLRSSD
jgi:hypothetical protein